MANHPPSLAAVPFFAGFDKTRQQYLQSHLVREDYGRGDTIIEQGIHGNFLAIVAAGKVEIQAAGEKARPIRAGELFGQEMLIDGTASRETVIARSAVSLWVLTRADWLASAQDFSDQAAPKSPPRTTPRWKPFAIAALSVSLVLYFLYPALGEFASITLPAWLAGYGQAALVETFLETIQPALPDSPRIQISLGYAKTFLQKNDEALQVFSQALTLQPDSGNIQNNLGVLLLTSGDPQKGLLHLQEAARLEPGRPEVFTNLGNAFLALGNRQAASSAYRRAFELDPGLLDARSLWASLAAEQGRFGQARQAWETVLQGDPRYAAAHQGLGVVDYLDHRPELALIHLESALLADPGDPISHYFRGLALAAMGKSGEAVLEFEAVSTLTSDPKLTEKALSQAKALK